MVKEYGDTTQRHRKRKIHFDDDPTNEVVLAPQDVFRTKVFVPVIDHLLSSALKHRIEAYEPIDKLFGFFK